MKIKRLNKIIIFTVAFCCFLCFYVFALEGLTENDKEKYINKLSIKSILAEQEIYSEGFIFSFDVAENGKCVMLFNDATIVVLDENGKTEKVLKFNEELLGTKARAATIRYNGDDLELLLGSDIIYSFTTDGKVLDVRREEITIDSSNKPSKIEVNGYTYEMKYTNPLIYFSGMNYDKLIRTDVSGNETVLFDSEGFLPETAIGFIVILGVFFITSIVVLIAIICSRANKKV